MLLHAIDLAPYHDRLIIKSEDTDVLVLLIYYKKKAPPLTYMHAGHTSQRTNRDKFIPVHSICGRLGENIANSLPAAYVLTGCDSTSSFYKIGKTTAYGRLVRYVEAVLALATMGTTSDLAYILPDVRRYVLILYENKKNKWRVMQNIG